MNTKTLNTYEKLWLANRASHNMALAGPTAFWLASGHRATGKPDPWLSIQQIAILCPFSADRSSELIRRKKLSDI